MTQHTLGPWRLHKYPVVNGGSGFQITSKELHGITIANLSPGTTSDRIESICEANAHLIAAAPELLDSLLYVDSAAPVDDSNGDPITIVVTPEGLRQIRAVLTKAQQ